MKLLLLEGDPASTAWLADKLRGLGFLPTVLPLRMLSTHAAAPDQYRAIVADLAGSGQDGRAIVASLRKSGIPQPILVLSSRDDWRDMIDCLDAGADDYLVKPVRSEVVAARIRAIVRRSAGNSTDRILSGDLELDLKGRCAWLANECLDLTRSEFRLLRLMMLQPDRVLAHDQIREQLYTDASACSHNAIEVQVARLRRKVGRQRIRTVRGVGYRFVPDLKTSEVTTRSREPCNSKGCGSNDSAGGRSRSERSSGARSGPVDVFTIPILRQFMH